MLVDLTALAKNKKIGRESVRARVRWLGRCEREWENERSRRGECT